MLEKEFFKGLKVIELAGVLAGPAVGMFFAELGADVLKIENSTTGGDMTRHWKLPSESKESTSSAYFCAVNWRKKYLFLDLTKKEDQNIALGFIKEADVLISNFKPSSAKKLGMDANQLMQLNPKLIYGQINAFADPDDESPAFDVVLQAEAGFLYINGPENGDPVKMPVALIDLLAAHQLKEAILIGLLQRERTGKGSIVATSLIESAIASLANQATNYLMANHIPQRMGTKHPNIAPYGDIYRCADEQPIVLAVGTERQFQQLCKVLDVLFLLENEKFASNTARVQYRSELNLILKEKITLKSSIDWVAIFNKNGVPVGKIRNMEAVFELPTAQNMILEEILEDGTLSKRVKTVAFHFEKVSD
jgi:crotonobetainyl-CoA:carnitine CoA-transferase CaiB-like acyl-CoA transferase